MPSKPATPSRTGPDLYLRAKRRIPGGTQLLSKRPEMFLPDNWPAYYRRAKGCTVWDLDDRAYVDFTSCGIGCCLLGFADETVNAAVTRRIADGSMCTLNSPDEGELADLLCPLVPEMPDAAVSADRGSCPGEAVKILVSG